MAALYNLGLSVSATGSPLGYALPVGSYIEGTDLRRRSKIEPIPLADGGCETADGRFEHREIKLVIRVYDAATPLTVATNEDTYWTTLRTYEGGYLIERADTTLVAAHKIDSVLGYDQARTRRVLERDHTVTYILSCHTSPAPYAPDGTQYPST